ncbi:MAG: hypothetical protein H6Q90_845, partial [Deltaproteobacteria bacterium]|nr:hypothetical protein [Deltaproteobacteria bacterium]
MRIRTLVAAWLVNAFLALVALAPAHADGVADEADL